MKTTVEVQLALRVTAAGGRRPVSGFKLPQIYIFQVFGACFANWSRFGQGGELGVGSFWVFFGIRAGYLTSELMQNQVWNLLQMGFWYATARAFPSADGFYFGFLRNALMGHFLFEFLSWTGRHFNCFPGFLWLIARCFRS